MRRALPLILVVALASANARAEPKTGDPVAEALFRDGKRLMNEGKFREACPKLAESQRLDPRLGTLLNLAACHAAEGKTATAWGEYTAAASQAAHAGRAELEQMARKELAALEPKLARVVIRAESAVADMPHEMTVTLDGTSLSANVLGVALPVDPGPHRIVANAPGRKPWSTNVDIAPGPSTFTVSIPALVAEDAPAVAPSLAPVAPVRDAPSRAAETPSRVSPLVVTLGGLAVVGIGVGTYFGVRAFAKNGDAESQCNGTACSEAGLALDRDARTAATVSTIAFSLAAVATVGAVWVFVANGSATRVGLAPGGVVVAGSF